MVKFISIYKIGFWSSFISYTSFTSLDLISDYKYKYYNNYELITGAIRIFSINFIGAIIWPVSVPMLAHYKYKQYMANQ